ncbi:hypothetical protein SSAG_05224 [Streptomyces sp. Mg1]|nr:hypothetical protein SSAG_05224 [Streptomyces sp. Mg1]
MVVPGLGHGVDVLLGMRAQPFVFFFFFLLVLSILCCYFG